jgi:LysR family hydrogen peroxide-inducible transcriptional activator
MIAVAEAGNFTVAAEKVFVTQPTLSMQIQKLEDELGVQIFNRTKKPIRLTNVGEQILKQARNILAEAKRMDDIVAQEKGFIGGEFKLGIIPTVMPTLLPMFLNAFINKHPKINLKIQELNTDSIINQLKEGKIDAGIAATPLKYDNIEERPLYYEPFVGYIPEQHRLNKVEQLMQEDLQDENILVLEEGHCFRNQALSFCSLKKNNAFDLKSGSFETLINLSNEGLGMTLVPYLNTLTLSRENKAKLKHFQDPPPAREISLVFPKSQLKIQIIDALQKTIEGIIRGAIVIENVKIISP